MKIRMSLVYPNCTYEYVERAKESHRRVVAKYGVPAKEDEF